MVRQLELIYNPRSKLFTDSIFEGFVLISLRKIFKFCSLYSSYAMKVAQVT